MSQQTLLSGFIGEVKELIEYTSSHVYVKNVKIEPDIVYFEEGFQGSHFKQTISVKNCGHNLVFIKILQPTPLAFQVSLLKYIFYINWCIFFLYKWAYIFLL